MVMRWILSAILVLAAACSDGDAASTDVDAGKDAASADGGSHADGGDDTDRDGGISSARDGSQPPERDAGTGAKDASASDAHTDDAAANDPDAGGAGITPEAACQALVDATCDWFHACRVPDGDCKSLGPTPIVAGRCATTPEAVASGRAAFHPFALDPCLAEARAATANCNGGPPPTLTVVFNAGSADSACKDVFVGLGAPGDDCYPAGSYGNDGCARSQCLGSECPGVCTPFLASGDSCGTDARSCGPHLFCSNGACREYLEADADCSDDLDRCVNGLYCDEGHHCRLNTALGKSCTTSAQCGGYACAPEGKNGALICFARVNAGAACKGDASCASELLCVDDECTQQVATGERCYHDNNCPSGTRCTRANASDELGSCEPRVGISEPCAELGDDDCQPGLYCDSSGVSPVCAARAAENEACQQVSCLEALWCDPNTLKCLALSPEGGACYREGFLGCANGLLCMGDGKCHAQGTESGDPCSGGSTLTCATGLSCDRATQTCIVLPGANGECNQGEQPSCQPDLWCACDGQPCQGSYDPWTGNSLEHCLSKVALGESCVDQQQCAEGVCGASGKCENPPPPCTGL
jgi:hypothetical protein